MTDKVPASHPYWFIRQFVIDQNLDIEQFNFSYYEYIPQSVVDNREIFSLTTKEFLNVELVSNLTGNVPLNKELAFHSFLKMSNGSEMHIPMVDMFTASVAQLSKLRSVLNETFYKSFRWYRSGRSFHGYGSSLICASEWSAFMGSLLLVNQQGFVPLVDPRWVGHRLISGYAALRWTKNTEQYIELPRSLDGA